MPPASPKFTRPPDRPFRARPFSFSTATLGSPAAARPMPPVSPKFNHPLDRLFHARPFSFYPATLGPPAAARPMPPVSPKFTLPALLNATPRMARPHADLATKYSSTFSRVAPLARGREPLVAVHRGSAAAMMHPRPAGAASRSKRNDTNTPHRVWGEQQERAREGGSAVVCF